MVNFVSLFLGLVVGSQTVVLEVAEPVARVEILLDGYQVAAVDGPPWRGHIDLGRELQPHELTAVAFDDAGVELDRTSQWLNLPRPPAETTILLEHDKNSQQQIARVSWKSLAGDEPSAVRVEFDGRNLDFDDPRAIPLPTFDPELLHFLRVELEFAGFVSSSAEITFGGTYADQVNTELTAFPVAPAEGHKKLPPEAELENGFLARDKPLRVAAVEKGLVDLIVVRDQGAWSELRRIRSQALTTPDTSAFNTRMLGSFERRAWFKSGRTGWKLWSFQFLWPVPRRLDSGTGPYDLFSHSAKHSAAAGSLHGWLTTVEQPAEWTGEQRLADAVAVAGVTAAGGNRRRGVLLVLGDQTKDNSDASPDTVRRYLESLAVPLFVWTVRPQPDDDTAWGPATDVSTPKRMSRATHKVFDYLESQRIVWLEGLHLPQQITLAASLQGTMSSAQDEETILGRPSNIEPSSREQETLLLEAGARLREQPRIDSPVLEILPAALELPVLDRQGTWVKVRFGTWQGWVHPDGDPPETGMELPLSLGPDEERLLHARSLLNEDAEPRPLGPFTLYTDVEDEELLKWLSAVARDVFRAYRERFGLDPGSEVREVLVVFADETNYRRFEAAEERIAKTDSRGYTSEGLSVLFTGEHGRTSLVSVFIHELTHLLNRRVFRTEVPAWLEEGMAEDLAFSQVTPQGQIRLGTLAGVQRQGVDDRNARSEPRAHLAALIGSWTNPTRPDLASLVAMDWEEFVRPDSRSTRYAASAMLVRYFSDGGESGLRQGFRRYLSAVSTAELPVSVSLWETLSAGPEEVEEGLYRFVADQARANGIR